MRPIVIVTLLISISCPAWAESSESAWNDIAQARVENSFSGMPLFFVENRGQMDDAVAYYVQGKDKALYFTSSGITFSLLSDNAGSASSNLWNPGDPAEAGGSQPDVDTWVLTLDFVNAQATQPRGTQPNETVYNYFKGTRDEWKTGIPTYSRIVYEDLWPGIDLVYSGATNELKYEFVVKPGADPSQIQLAYEGISDLGITSSGSLQVTTPVRSFEDDSPYVFQESNGERTEVQAAYALHQDKGFSYGFDIGEYDPQKTLIIDPALLCYCGYIGGSNLDEAHDIAVDSDGNTYIVGTTYSHSTSFPILNGPGLTYKGSIDAFVAKVDASGTGLLYCGYIGGNDMDEAWGVDVDADGNAYVTGTTHSDENSFPVATGPDLTHNGKKDIFVAKVNPSGTALAYCGYIGGEEDDEAYAIGVDSHRNAYIAGYSESDDDTFPVVTGPDLSYYNEGDGVVAKIDASGTSLIYCGYIAGGETDKCTSLALDDDGNLYVGGITYSPQSVFPDKIGPTLIFHGHFFPHYPDGFVAKVNAAGTGLDYCGYIGGRSYDYITAVDVDQHGNLHATGYTLSTPEDFFPLVTGPDMTHGGYHDAIVAKVNSIGSGFDYCGYMGGPNGDYGRDIAVDDDGNVYMTGHTGTHQTKFPVTSGPDITHNGHFDAYVAKLDASGMTYQFCGYIGGDEPDEGFGIALGDNNEVYVAGKTRSVHGSFPAMTGPDVTANGHFDAFVAKITMAPGITADANTLSEQGGVVNFELNATPVLANRNYFLLGGVTGTSPGVPLPQGWTVLPINWDVFTDTVLSLMNTPLFADFTGTLDAHGKATAQLNWPGPSLPPGTVGLTMNFAYLVNMTWEFASDSVNVEIVP